MQGKLLQLSQRRIANLVANCQGYEFEDTVAAVTNAERIDTTDLPGLDFSRRAYKLARMASRSPRFARRLAPYPRNKVVLKHDFELFFPAFNHIYELYSLAMILNWRERSKRAACFITEAWADGLPEYLLELLTGFDHVFLGNSETVQTVARMTGRPCSYLPLAVDVRRFAPASLDEPRPINVAHLGRRSQVTHQALFEEAERRRLFYYYDTVAAGGSDLKDRTFRVISPSEHRRLLATLLKRSRYFIANRGFVNRPEFTAGRDAISSRFYEGAASGTVMLGEAPRCDAFKGQFDWPDAVIHLPFDSPDVNRILKDLDADTERLRAARRNNLREAALRHDWLYRIQVVFDTLGLPYTAKMQARAQLLEHIALRASAL